MSARGQPAAGPRPPAGAAPLAPQGRCRWARETDLWLPWLDRTHHAALAELTPPRHPLAGMRRLPGLSWWLLPLSSVLGAWMPWLLPGGRYQRAKIRALVEED